MSDLDYKVWMITSVLDVDFTGTTDEDKQAFVDEYWAVREKVVQQMLSEAFKEMVEEGVQNE